MEVTEGQLYFVSEAKRPTLEFYNSQGKITEIPFTRIGAGRNPYESQWLARPRVPGAERWKFRLKVGKGRYHHPIHGEYFSTPLRTLWVQDHQIFSYRPGPIISPPRVIKVPAFKGSLPTRALYIYLPRGYDNHLDRFYPVLYMHDGQNCFEAFVQDSFSGSWHADSVANRLIAQGQMRECLIVGVSNGQSRREVEYLPPYTTVRPRPPVENTKSGGMKKKTTSPLKPVLGQADKTLAYYRDEVAQYLERRYRVLIGREHTATCGSSLGGLFSTYIAWEHTEFARHHAALSSSYWITRTRQGTLETVERLRTGQPRDIRLWLDSGTLDSPGKGDDGLKDTIAAREALLENGYVIGPDFQYYVAEGAIHHEAAWAARLDNVFRFLFPVHLDNA